jgi:hypothetical protein
MFRKLQERLSTAAASAWSSWSETDLQRLVQLGFSHDEARSAMDACNGNVDEAASLLLARNMGPNDQTFRAASAIESDEDEQLRQAMEASRTMEMEQQQARRHRTAAMNKAAEAALRRNEPTSKKQAANGGPKSNTPKAAVASTSSSPPESESAPSTIPRSAAILRDYHPEVKLIPKLQDKSTEEQILRTADRLRTSPAAVDVLYKVLTALRDDPTNPQYQRLSCQTAGYQRTIQPAVGAEDFLRAMRFFKDGGQYWIMNGYDPALLYLGISALEQKMQTTEYLTTKKELAFEKEVAAILGAAVSAEERAARGAHLKKIPKEPSSGPLVTIEVLAETKIQRRFDADDTVADMLHWMASAVGTTIYEKVVTKREWSLTDRNQKTFAALDMSKQHLTLQYVGCWPSGRLFLTHHQ